MRALREPRAPAVWAWKCRQPDHAGVGRAGTSELVTRTVVSDRKLCCIETKKLHGFSRNLTQLVKLRILALLKIFNMRFEARGQPRLDRTSRAFRRFTNPRFLQSWQSFWHFSRIFIQVFFRWVRMPSRASCARKLTETWLLRSRISRHPGVLYRCPSQRAC